MGRRSGRAAARARARAAAEGGKMKGERGKCWALAPRCQAAQREPWLWLCDHERCEAIDVQAHSAHTGAEGQPSCPRLARSCGEGELAGGGRPERLGEAAPIGRSLGFQGREGFLRDHVRSGLVRCRGGNGDAWLALAAVRVFQ